MSNFGPVNYYSNPFSDVAKAAWYAPAVKQCYEFDIITGANGIFDPAGTLSVAQALAIVDRIHGIYTTGADQLTGSGWRWYDPYVAYAVKNGIINETTFDSYTRPITRGEAAYLFSRALPAGEFYAINSISAISDVTESDYESAVLLLYNAGVLTGEGTQHLYRPNDTLKRAEIAAVAARTVDPSLRVSFSMAAAPESSAT